MEHATAMADVKGGVNLAFTSLVNSAFGTVDEVLLHPDLLPLEVRVGFDHMVEVMFSSDVRLAGLMARLR